MAIRTLPCPYLPYFLLLFSNFQDVGVLNYAWAWVVCQVLCLDVAESSCNGRGPDNHGLQLPLAYLAFDVPSSPNARLDAYLTSHKTYLIGSIHKVHTYADFPAFSTPSPLSYAFHAAYQCYPYAKLGISLTPPSPSAHTYLMDAS